MKSSYLGLLLQGCRGHTPLIAGSHNNLAHLRWPSTCAASALMRSPAPAPCATLTASCHVCMQRSHKQIQLGREHQCPRKAGARPGMMPYTPVSDLDETGRPTRCQVLFKPLHGRSSSAGEVAMQCSGSGMAL